MSNAGWIVMLSAFLAAQAGALVWSLSSVTTTIRFLGEQIAHMRGQLEQMATKENIEIVHKRIDKLDARVRELEQRG